MAIFELAWTWYDDYKPYLFSHPTKTEKEFEADIKFLMNKCGAAYLENLREDQPAKVGPWVAIVAENMKELGYERIMPVCCTIWGGRIDEFGEDTDDLEKYAEKDLIQKAIDHNDRYENLPLPI